MTRIAFIGAGSVVFTKNLLGDILSFPELAGAEIALHDIDAGRLATAEAMARWVAHERSASPTISSHLDRRAAIDGADYVINMVQIGGHEATLLDFEIPARYGLRQTIADTLGIGGIFRTLRTADHMLALGRETAELCPPGAWLLNYTNPMSMLTWLVYAGTPTQNVVGLCHSVQGTTEDLAKIVGVPIEEVTYLAAGLNHQAFILRFEHEGEDLYPRLDAAIEADADLQRRVRVELYRRLGYFQTESSEHAAEYVPWFMRHDDQIDRFRIFVGDYLERSEENLLEFESLRHALDSPEPLDLAPENELASLFIHALETGTERELHVNIRNGGLISSLPDGCCVEVPCLVGAGGAKPVPVGALPPQLAALNRTFLNVVELTVRAALEESRDHVYQAALLDPNTAATLTTTQVVAMCDNLFAVHRDLLPPALRS